MPIVFQKEVNPDLKLAVWHIEEEISVLLPLIHASDKLDIKDEMLEKKQLEVIATRLLLKDLIEKSGLLYNGIIKDTHGKPHLKISGGVEISISHSFPYAAAIIDKTSATGIDIEASRDQIKRIRHKFMSETELATFTSVDDMTIVWAAKECLYKIFGRRQLIFRQDLSVTKLDDNTLLGEIQHKGYRATYQLRCEKVGSQWLVFKELHNEN